MGGTSKGVNVELKNLDESLEALQHANSIEAQGRKQYRGHKTRLTASKEEAEANVADDLDAVINHIFAYTDARPHLSMEQVLALRRLLRQIDGLKEGNVHKSDAFDDAFAAAIHALDGERLEQEEHISAKEKEKDKSNEEKDKLDQVKRRHPKDKSNDEKEKSKKEGEKSEEEKDTLNQAKRRRLRPTRWKNLNLEQIFGEEFGDLDL